MGSDNMDSHCSRRRCGLVAVIMGIVRGMRNGISLQLIFLQWLDYIVEKFTTSDLEIISTFLQVTRTSFWIVYETEMSKIRIKSVHSRWIHLLVCCIVVRRRPGISFGTCLTEEYCAGNTREIWYFLGVFGQENGSMALRKNSLHAWINVLKLI
jgi:hypothetical protein